MYTGVAIFRKKIVEKIDHIRFFDTLETHDFTIKTFVYDGTWMDIGDPRLYFEANAGYKRRLNIDSRENSLSEHVTISPGSLVSNCIAWENTTITGRSTLSNCIVTGNLTLHDVDYSDKIIYAGGEKTMVMDLQKI
jgi:NDP-sugar pyrophosphorylase family protein